MMSDDMDLVREYAASDSERAFATLVERHIGLVHSAALRQVGDVHLAQEITQTVFIILARKAKALGPGTILSAWLYRTTRYAAADALKRQRRHQQREHEAYMQSTLLDEQTDAAWTQLAPRLDETMARTAMETEAAARAAGYPKMQSDPATKQAMQQSRLTAFRSIYGPLFKGLKLTPQQTEKAAQAIGEVVQTQIDKWFVLPQGSLSQAEIAQAGAERDTEWERQLQPILGEAGCFRLCEFEKELPVHAAIDLLNAQLGASQLSDEQNARLLQVLKAEPYDLIRNVTGESWDPAFWRPQDYVDKHLQNIAESNQRILEQAGSFLTPEQSTVFSTVLSNGINARVAQAAAFIRKP